jgi:hypothetical protein
MQRLELPGMGHYPIELHLRQQQWKVAPQPQLKNLLLRHPAEKRHQRHLALPQLLSQPAMRM